MNDKLVRWYFYFYRFGAAGEFFFIAFTVTPVAPMFNTRLCILLLNVCLLALFSAR